MTSFQYIFFYSFHRMWSAQTMRWYSAYYFEVTVHQILIELLLFKDCSDMTSFLVNSSNSFHWIGLKLSEQLDH